MEDVLFFSFLKGTVQEMGMQGVRCCSSSLQFPNATRGPLVTLFVLLWHWLHFRWHVLIFPLQTSKNGYCYGLNVFLPNLYVETLTLKGGGINRWGLGRYVSHEGGALMNEKGGLENSQPLPHVRIQLSWPPRRGPSSDHAGSLISGF